MRLKIYAIKKSRIGAPQADKGLCAKLCLEVVLI
jgi:hypothetical protein